MNRAEVIVDLGAIEANLRRILSQTSATGLAVVKANAYGHGLIPVAERALKAGAKWLGTALLEEALALRAAKITAPILAWLTPISSDFESAIRNEIDLAIPSIDHLNSVINAAKQLGKSARIHLEVDTGMSRGGALSEWIPLCEQAKRAVDSGHVKVIGAWSHFARADEPGENLNDQQIANFDSQIIAARESGIDPEIIHLSNSAATINDKRAHRDLVRVGIGMYGLSPSVESMGDSPALGLQPAMSIRAELHLVKEVPAGSQVGYGGIATTDRVTKLGIIPMGYSDGLPRSANSMAGVLIGNKRAPIIGRVSMDQFVVDLGNDSIARAGDWAYLISPIDSAGYTADAWAQASGTINYEIVTRIAHRVPRIYVN